MRKAGIPEALVRAVMSLYKGAKTEEKVGTHLSEEIEVNVGGTSGISFINTVVCHCD